MKILWVVNIPLPELCLHLGIPVPAVGGWLSSLAHPLSEVPGIELGIAAPFAHGSGDERPIGKIRYFLFSADSRQGVYSIVQENALRSIVSRFHPDIVHIHGTEHPHSMAAANVAEVSRVVVSIQGLISVYFRYYYGGIRFVELLKNVTLRDILRRDTFFQQRSRMRKRAIPEIALLKKVRHVIGRTDWDAAHVLAINPQLHYHHGDEVLRQGFFQESWNQKTKITHTILIPQSQYPIKGLHQALPAFAMLRKKYPDLKVNITGNSTLSLNFLRQNGYGKYISSLIAEFDLASCCRFTGMLDEAAMCREFLRCHVAVSPSAIENSSNALCEAQLLGVPCVASCAGGTPSLVRHGETGLLYRFEEPEALAFQIDRIFCNPQLAETLSRQEREVALVRHNPERNVKNLLHIYHEIL